VRGLPTPDIGDVGDGGGIWKAKHEIARSDTRAEWWVHFGQWGGG
jgi:hypothetical protein